MIVRGHFLIGKPGAKAQDQPPHREFAGISAPSGAAGSRRRFDRAVLARHSAGMTH
jgi:hypothetical protein